MEVFFLIIVGYFLLPILLGLAKPKTAKSKPKPQAWINPPAGEQRQNSRSQQLNKAADLRSRLQAAQTARAAMSQKAARKETVKPHSKDYLDRNSRRRTDWGKRASPEVVSTQNILLAAMFALIIYLGLQVLETF